MLDVGGIMHSELYTSAHCRSSSLSDRHIRDARIKVKHATWRHFAIIALKAEKYIVLMLAVKKKTSKSVKHACSPGPLSRLVDAALRVCDMNIAIRCTCCSTAGRLDHALGVQLYAEPA